MQPKKGKVTIDVRAYSRLFGILSIILIVQVHTDIADIAAAAAEAKPITNINSNNKETTEN